MLTTILVIVGYGIISGAAGFAVCRATHRQRGLDVDSFSITYGPTPAGKV